MNPPKKNTGSNSFNEIATLRIELQDTDPVIWRQVEVPTSVTLKVLTTSSRPSWGGSINVSMSYFAMILSRWRQRAWQGVYSGCRMRHGRRWSPIYLMASRENRA